MKTLCWLLGCAAIALAVCGAAIRGGDRQTLVPPPEAVAEAFARAVAERRYELAIHFLSADLARTVNGDALRRRFEPIRRQIGDEGSTEAMTEWLQDDAAAARATIMAQHGSVSLQLPMVRESGLWRIDRLPEDPAVALRPSAR